MVFEWAQSLFRKRKIALTWDSISDGQVQSKVWLLDEFSLHREALQLRTGETVWHLAGWNGVLGFLLLSHPDFRDLRYQVLDFDGRAIQEGYHLNSSWSHQKRFSASYFDIEKSDWLKLIPEGESPFIINTSVEHFRDDRWWKILPKGSRCILQATDLPHREHCSPTADLNSFQLRFPDLKVVSATEKVFDYGHLCFRRFMLMGIKT